MRTFEENKQIEEAIKFLVFAVQKTGHNPKPVILHSIRVGLHLYSLAYNRDIVIAGILHDIVEDTETTIDKIKLTFGANVSKLVQANSFNKEINDRVSSYKENFERCYKAGKSALIIKAADLFDNADYCCFDEKGKRVDWWVKKIKYFIEMSEDIIKDEAIYKELKAKCGSIVKT